MTCRMKGAERLGIHPPKSPLRENQIFNSGKPTIHLLVEAGPDEKFWSRWVEERVQIRNGNQGGKAWVLAELSQGREVEGTRMVGIVDADLDRILGTLSTSPDLVFTDSHDLESTLISGPALEDVAAYFARSKVLEAEARWKMSLRERLFQHAESLGRLRWLKVLHSLPLQFKKERTNKRGNVEEVIYFDDYNRCVGDDWTPSRENCIKTICNYSNAQILLPPRRDLGAECRNLGEVDISQLCNGHDLVGFLRCWLIDVAKISSKPSIEELFNYIALTVRHSWLENTDMWRKLQDWESNHSIALLIKVQGPLP